jgi:hypothetical protein
MRPRQPNPSLTDSLAFLRDSKRLGVLTGSGERVWDANDAFLKMAGLTRAKMQPGQIDWGATIRGDFFPLHRRGIAGIKGMKLRTSTVLALTRISPFAGA